VPLSAYRTSPSSSLSVLANEPPLYIHRKRLSIQYSLKLSSNAENPAYSGVFADKFKSAFDRKPNQIPPLGIRVEPDLHAIGFQQKDICQSSISVTPPWLLTYTASISRTLLRRFTEADFMSSVPNTMVSIVYTRTKNTVEMLSVSFWKLFKAMFSIAMTVALCCNKPTFLMESRLSIL